MVSASGKSTTYSEPVTTLSLFRWVIYPISATKASLGLSLAPGGLEKLWASVAAKGRSMEDVTIPVCAVKLTETAGTNLEVPMLPTAASQGLSEFKGWGLIPLILNTDGTKRPSSEDIRREAMCLMSKVRGHNNRSSIATFYPAEGEGPVWPETEQKVLLPEEKWPEWKAVGDPNTPAIQGRKFPIIVKGVKYGGEGGYTQECVSPLVKGKYAAVLLKAANGSLASNTWKSYTNVWNNIDKISQETGVKIAYPMSMDMIQAIIGFYLVRGVKADTIKGYLSSLKLAHSVKGLDSSIMEHSLVDTVLRGAKNLESILPKEAKSVVTLSIMEKIWTRIKGTCLPMDDKRLLWAVITMLFMGSLRPSEALCIHTLRYDEAKTLTWNDIKLVDTRMDGERVDFLQLKLKSPKTARPMPEQIVEILGFGTKFCAVRAFSKWSTGRKIKQAGSTPVFTKANGELVTVSYLNSVLAEILKDEKPKITARAFRPGLSTILARKGVSSESLKSLGRWTSKAFEVYIRRGRANNWRTIRTQLLEMGTN